MHDVDALLRQVAPGIEITDIAPRSGGELSTVFEVGRRGGPPLIVKIYSSQWAWKQAKEVHVYGLLADHLAGRIPAVVHAEPAGEAPAFTVLTKVDGVPLSEVTPPDPRAIYVQLGALLAAVHRIAQPAYGYLTDQVLDPLPTNAQYMERQFTKKLDEFTRLGGDQRLARRAVAYVDEHRGVLANNDAPVLCHNDFHEGNVLVDPQTWRVQGVIDVENAIAADPLVDLAKTECYSIRGDTTKLAGLVDGYGPLPADWRERLTLYRLYHAIELWDWFCSIGRLDPLDGIAGDIETIVAPAS